MPKPSEIAAASSWLQLALFRVGDGEFAADIMGITEIIRPQKVTRIPRSPAFVEGVINLRGRVVPIVGMRERFGLEKASGEGRKARVIIVRTDGRLIGALVDEVMGVVRMAVDQVEETPETAQGACAQFVKGVAKDGERLVVVLDMQRLLTSRELKELDESRELEGEVPGGGEG
jgi:purine-binding chemotaxis protein CheW